MRMLLGALVLAIGSTGSLVSAQGSGISAQTYQAWMKSAGAANAALRMKLMDNQAAAIGPESRRLAQIFGDVEKFWAQNRKADAVKLAQDASRFFAEAGTAAAAGDGVKATMAANNAAASCRQCHGTYREGDARTGFRIKAGSM